MKLLVTGATGFIGRNLCKRLNEESIDFRVIVRRIPDNQKFPFLNDKYFLDTMAFQELKEYLLLEKFDGVIHLASVFIPEHQPSDIPAIVESNILFPTRLLEAAVAAQIPWFLNTGTSWQHYKDANYNPVNLYAASKQAFEDMASYYIESSDIVFSTLKLNDTYGQGDTRRKIFNLWKEAATEQRTLEMSPGEQGIDIVYISDVIDSFLAMINHLNGENRLEYNKKSFSVSSGKPLSLKELAKVFSEASGLSLNVKWGGRAYRKREVMTPCSFYPTVPGWHPKVSLKEGIKLFLKEVEK